jgi:hypothetical protein
MRWDGIETGRVVAVDGWTSRAVTDDVVARPARMI